MASSTMIIALPLFIAISLLLPSAFAGVICEELPQDLCAFSISSSGMRCILESPTNAGSKYHCGTSEVVVADMADWIETDACVRACGVDRHTVGISSDALLERNFREMICSDACYKNCPNIVDLYSNLASGEGVKLSEICKSVNSSRDRIMLESAGAYAYAPTPAPAPSPSYFYY
ncbi:hypothetical protein LUZ60_010853 [Juncus effusus]|nr:hypothetical protein LUZ60_010853 [Juncus effusus]